MDGREEGVGEMVRRRVSVIMVEREGVGEMVGRVGVGGMIEWWFDSDGGKGGEVEW